jgi:hypothetical protein
MDVFSTELGIRLRFVNTSEFGVLNPPTPTPSRYATDCHVHTAQTEPHSEPSEPTLHHHTAVAEIHFNIILTLHMRLCLPSKLSLRVIFDHSS